MEPEWLARLRWGGGSWRAGLVVVAPYMCVMLVLGADGTSPVGVLAGLVAIGGLVLPLQARREVRQWPEGWALARADRMTVVTAVRQGRCPDDARLAAHVMARAAMWRRAVEEDHRMRCLHWPLPPLLILTAGMLAATGQTVAPAALILAAGAAIVAVAMAPARLRTVRDRTDRAHVAARAVLEPGNPTAGMDPTP